jgi:hypothetical protein
MLVGSFEWTHVTTNDVTVLFSGEGLVMRTP